MEPGATRASIIIVAYNGLDYIERCLDSVLKTLSDRDELIVVDNASTDGTPDAIVQICPAAGVVCNPTNVGFAAACNQGAQEAKGEILVFLNQDTYVSPGWLSTLIEGLHENGGGGLTTSKILQMQHPDRIHLCGQDVHYTGLVFGRGFQETAGRRTAAEAVDAVAGASFAITRQLWEALGGFDETFFMYYEETDLSWRARLRGYTSRYVPNSIVFHDYRPRSMSAFQAYHIFRNRCLMALKNWRWRTLGLLFPSLLLAGGIDWWLALGLGFKGVQAKVKANLWIIGHFRYIAQQHAQVQQERQVSDAEMLREFDSTLQPRERVLGRGAGKLLHTCDTMFKANRKLALNLCQRRGW
ncbi:MAG: glycosyltransferase family 2 protein [Anaerolineae bacterium]|nr:glycosyltransferase family 2 protein [Anaerolineae bacterium]